MSYPHATHSPVAVYELQDYAASPVTLADMKNYLRISGTSEDTFIQSLIDAATAWSEDYTGRQFRQNTWKLYLDQFPTRIDLNRSPVESVESITHLVDNVVTAVNSADYYLKQLTQLAEILLVDGADWPTNTDDREQAIVVSFTAGVYTRGLDRFKTAVMQLVAYLYENRGDCACDIQSAKASGATLLLDMFRIARI